MNATQTTLDTPKSLRVRLNLTQQAAADRARVSVRTLRKLERGEDISSESFSRLAEVYGVTPGSLMDAMHRERFLRRSRKAAPLLKRKRAS